MKNALGLLALVIVTAMALSAQSGTKPPDSPKTTIGNFLSAVMNGDLQTANSWEQVNAFFTHPSSMLQGQPIIIGTDYSTQQEWIRGTHAEVVVTYRELGRIDSSLGFHQSLASAKQVSVRYLLIYVSTPVTGDTAKGSGTRQWRIQNPPRLVWTGLPAAIRYVTEVRANTNDALTKKNADRTLRQLQKLQ